MTRTPAQPLSAEEAAIVSRFDAAEVPTEILAIHLGIPLVSPAPGTPADTARRMVTQGRIASHSALASPAPAPQGDCSPWHSDAFHVLALPRLPVTADVQRELASTLCKLPRVWTGDFGPYEIAAALLPTVQRLIADAEKRAAAAALREAAEFALANWNEDLIWLRDRAAALDSTS